MRLSKHLICINLWNVNNSKNTKVIKSFGKNLRRIRLSKGISQEYLADSAKIMPSQIGRIERGEINATISTAYVLAKALEVDFADLFKFKVGE